MIIIDILCDIKIHSNSCILGNPEFRSIIYGPDIERHDGIAGTVQIDVASFIFEGIDSHICLSMAILFVAVSNDAKFRPITPQYVIWIDCVFVGRFGEFKYKLITLNMLFSICFCLAFYICIFIIAKHIGCGIVIAIGLCSSSCDRFSRFRSDRCSLNAPPVVGERLVS